ncbi:MAG TPA: FecR domain-containing protein [Armatimonadota bacterium]|nr:FecR domain-containing protein [Armatimonadota bacterium]
MADLSAGDLDIARLLSAHYQEVSMEDAYSASLLARTSALVTSRSRTRLRRWAPRLAAAAAIVLLAIGIWRLALPRLHSSEGDRALPAFSSPDTLAAIPGAAVSPEKGGVLVAVTAARGSVTDASGMPIELGDKLSVGASICTGPDSRVTLITRRGSEYTLAPNTALKLVKPDTASLDAGRLYCRSRAGEITRIDTAPGRIHLLGTALDAAVEAKDTVAVTVLEGTVRLTNSLGETEVPSGRRALLVASRPPELGQAVNPRAAAAWYYGRRDIVSDFGDIAYVLVREQAEGLTSEVWAMHEDGSGKHRLKTYLGWGRAPGPWLPGQQWLVFNAHSVLWTTPDFENRRAHTGAGHPILDDQAWLINAATGQDLAFDLPPGADPLYTDLSPDGTRLAFCGSYQPDPNDPSAREGGVWVFDMTTGEMKKLLDGYIKTPISWAPDGRRIVADTSQGYVLRHPLVVVDADTGEVRDLGVDGAGGVFSPDGRKLAYPGDFQESGSWAMGVPTSGRIMLYDLPSGKAKPISPSGEGALQPRWSPDGRSVAYMVQSASRDDRTVTIFVVAADGSGVSRTYDCTDGLLGYAWMPSGDALYLATAKGIRIIAADGSGLLSDLGGKADDSVLTPEQARQTQAALDAVREAVFQYAVANVRGFEGKPKEEKAAFGAAFEAASDIFAGIVWEYPLAQFSLDQILLYADKAAAEANQSRAEVLAQSCEERLGYLGILLLQYVGAKDEFPPNLAALEKYSLESEWGINYISSKNTDWVKLIFRCSEGRPYTYHRPSGDPHIGDVIAACRAHPGSSLVWTEGLEQQLAWYSQTAK